MPGKAGNAVKASPPGPGPPEPQGRGSNPALERGEAEALFREHVQVLHEGESVAWQADLLRSFLCRRPVSHSLSALQTSMCCPSPAPPLPCPQELYEEVLEGFLDLLDREIKVGVEQGWTGRPWMQRPVWAARPSFCLLHGAIHLPVLPTFSDSSLLTLSSTCTRSPSSPPARMSTSLGCPSRCPAGAMQSRCWRMMRAAAECRPSSGGSVGQAEVVLRL